MKCPICKQDVKPGDPDFPFCSERCKLIDLGRWLGGRYQVPVAEKDESDAPTTRDDDEPRH